MDDPYVYPGTDVLQNKLGLRDAEKLQDVEKKLVAVRYKMGLPQGKFDQSTTRFLADRPIDLAEPDGPEITDWSVAERGKFYPPVKQELQTQTEDNGMDIAGEIRNEVIDLPFVLQTEALDFIQRLKQERGIAKSVGNSLDEFIGGWSTQEQREFNAAVAAMEQIDEELWQ